MLAYAATVSSHTDRNVKMEREEYILVLQTSLGAKGAKGSPGFRFVWLKDNEDSPRRRKWLPALAFVRFGSRMKSEGMVCGFPGDASRTRENAFCRLSF